MSLELSKRAAGVKPSSTLAISDKAKQLRAAGRDVVSFGAGEPDFPTPKNICDAAVKAINDGFTKYTAASGIVELKEAICEKFKKFNKIDYEPSQVVISNGGKHSLTNVFSAIVDPGDEVIIPSPYWLSYPEMIKLVGGVPVYVQCRKENGYKISAAELEAAITPKTKAFVLNTPNNPTGMLYSREELQSLADVAVKKDIYCIADEMYENLVYTDEEFVSIASLNDEIYKRTITVSGMAKSYSMTGWRIGYTGSSKEIAKAMGSIQSHQTSNPNSIAQKAAVEALRGPQDTVAAMKEEFKKRSVYTFERIDAMPHVSMIKPTGAFYAFVDVSETFKMSHKGTAVKDVFGLADILLNEYDVAVIPCSDFGFPTHIRLSYATSLEIIKKGLDRIETFLKTLA